MKKIQNYIGGDIIAPISNSYFDNYEPAIGKVYSQIPDSDEKDIDLAVKAAQKAFPIWSNMPKQERSNILLKFFSISL